MRLPVSLFIAFIITGAASAKSDQPNILWIVTDDQRSDSLACVNQATRGENASPLGFVSSPEIDELAAEGVLFTHAYCNSPGCAPSRVSMITGRYPHRNGTYGFKQSHNRADFCKPTFPELLRDQGYATARFGKSGVYIFEWGPGLTWDQPDFYDHSVDMKHAFQRKGLTEFHKEKTRRNGKAVGAQEKWFFPGGEEVSFLTDAADGDVPEEDKRRRVELDEKLDILRAYTRDQTMMVIGGRSPQPAGKTLDGHIVAAFEDYVKTTGAKSDKPLFVNLGFHFPHTPVLPPQEFRDLFAGKTYAVPEFKRDELKKLPPQLVTLHKKMQIDGLKPEEKQQAIRDYYAFCAYGDSLIGKAVKTFRETSEQAGREWLVVITCGDHGWHLGEQGIEAKFGPYEMSNRCSVVALSSDKKKFPAGFITDKFVEFVDFAPTFLAAAGADKKPDFLDGMDLAGLVDGSEAPRDYVLGEMNHVYGPRAYLRSREFAFSMRTRPTKGFKLGKNLRWGLDAPREDVEMSLFDLRSDPGEQNNVANDASYLAIADFFRTKLGNIVLGDGRVECDWSKENEYTVGNFAPGAHDRKLAVPSGKELSKKPNIILIYADDISARELPMYGSSVWSPPTGGDSSDPAFRAKTPVLDQLAEEGCMIKTAWAATVCSPSRAMMMTGRYAHIHKWWNNKDVGTYTDAKGRVVKWPLYKSSPMLIGHVAAQAGYSTLWAGKTQMPADLTAYGFAEGCFTPGNLEDRDNPFTDFKHYLKKVDGEKLLFNADTDKPVDTYQQHGWYWFPHVRLMNHPSSKEIFGWWPNTEKSKRKFSVNTYGPDVELDFIFEHMERQQGADKPFFIYHTSHLGHDAFDWLNPASKSKWPGTPVIKWDGKKYTRTEPNVTGDKGVYETHGTVTEPGIHRHVNYLDYQVWLYRNKLEEMGIADNTVLIFCADNGTSGYGKNSADRQKGTHVPLIIHAPGMTKKGKQDVLASMADMLPTIVDLTGAALPDDYEINGESLVPFLFTDKATHRDYLYAYRNDGQLIRGTKVLKDARNKWWDIAETPDDLIGFKQIKDWSKVSPEHRAERDRLKKILPPFDVHATEHDAPKLKRGSTVPAGR